MIKVANKKYLLGIAILVLLAFALRVWFVFGGAVSFHYDMARDAFIAEQIWKYKDLKIQGPPTSSPGLYHGVVYYYLIAPFYALGNGDPRVVSVALSLLNSLTVIPIVLLAKSVFNSFKKGLLAGLLFAVAFEATQYGPWISNPAPAMLTIAVFFYSLWLLIQKHRWGLPMAVAAAALSTHFQFFLLYLFGVLAVFMILFKVRVSFRAMLYSFVIGLFILSPFAISAIKFKSFGTLTGGLVGIAGSKQFDFQTQFTELFFNYLNRFADIFINNFFPSNVLIGGLLGLVVLFFARQNRFIIFCLLSNLLIFIFGGHSTNFVNIGMIVPAILAVIFFLQKVWGRHKVAFYMLTALLVSSNLYMTFKVSPRGQAVLVLPKDMVLNKQLKLVDETYQIAEGKPFSINALNLPIWINTTWVYLYHYYGDKKYGYLPTFYGRDQVGQLGQSALKKVNQPEEITFYILEPTDGIPPSLFQSEVEEENSKTILVRQIDYGALKLQIRKPKTFSD